MTTKRKNPYQMLADECREWARKVKYAHSPQMWLYPKARLSEGWELTSLYERVAAADQLGYDVLLRHDSKEGLRVVYRKRAPESPWAIRP